MEEDVHPEPSGCSGSPGAEKGLRILSAEGVCCLKCPLRYELQREYEKRARGHWLLRGRLEREAEGHVS